jgi:hypothetical protein
MAPKHATEAGKLKIGDHWNIISIIALSQNNPLKAIAEFVENSIDAGAKNVTIVRGKQNNEHYIKVIDDGCGIKDFRYVATHIGDSIKRELKHKGNTELQGEFGIGLLSFWTVGETCTLTSMGEDGVVRSMRLVKGNPAYAIREVGALLGRKGTELTIRPILPGVRSLSGDKIQNFLASELRDRITKSGVRISIIDHTSRRELIVEPRKFKGRLLHQLPEVHCPLGEIYLELYMAESPQDAVVSLQKKGTRVLSDISHLDSFSHSPWNTRQIEGLIDVPFLQLTPGTRDGVVQDEAFHSFCIAIAPIEEALNGFLEEQRRAEEEEVSRQILHRVTRAFREAFLHLPTEDYSWLAARTGDTKRSTKAGPKGVDGMEVDAANSDNVEEPTLSGTSGEPTESAEMDASLGEYIPKALEKKRLQKEFFEYAGPLYKVIIFPASSVIGVGERKKLKAVVRDRAGRNVESEVSFAWHIAEGGGSLDGVDSVYAEYTAPDEPCVATIEVKATQKDIAVTANALITVTANLIKRSVGSEGILRRGLPGYSYQKAPGQLWRSRYDVERSIIFINNAHADFIFASRQPMMKLRYITRLFAKELVLANFPEATKEEILERLVELTLYTEENLK